MHKRQLHRLLKHLKRIHTLYFVFAIIIVGAVAVSSLRHNNIRSIELREQVLEVDKNNGDVEKALRELRQHIYGHMNSGLAVSGGAYPPIQLKYRYERLAAVEKERVAAANAQLYTQAQAHCEALIPTGRSLNRIDCIQNYITERGGATEQSVPDSLYKFDFAAPRWSPDLAGWSLLLLFVLVILFITRTVSVLWLKHTLHE